MIKRDTRHCSCPQEIYYTVRISFDLASTALSTFATYSSVSFCALSSKSLISSSEISSALPDFLMLSIASLLMLRMATFVFSPFFLISFASSLRLSSVSSGNTRRINFPSFVGLIPKSEQIIAFSIYLTIEDSQG